MSGIMLGTETDLETGFSPRVHDISIENKRKDDRLTGNNKISLHETRNDRFYFLAVRMVFKYSFIRARENNRNALTIEIGHRSFPSRLEEETSFVREIHAWT